MVDISNGEGGQFSVGNLVNLWGCSTLDPERLGSELRRKETSEPVSYTAAS